MQGLIQQARRSTINGITASLDVGKRVGARCSPADDARPVYFTAVKTCLKCAFGRTFRWG